MTRKHYKLIAEVIDNLPQSGEFEISQHHRETIARNLAAAFKADNAAFDEDKFLKACGAWS